MAGFRDIIGQESIVNHMKSAIKMHKISHAYILNGEAGMGKKSIAKAFAMTLQCEKKMDEPCMECHSCKQALSGNHPDIKWVTHEKSATISVDEIREQVNDDIVIKPYSSEYKIYIIDEAEKMNTNSQNALLKTIEEPPSYAIIILLVNNKDNFLQTILSRCVSLDLRPVKNQLIMDYLMKNEHIPDYKAKIVVNFAAGNIGKAIRLATMEDFNKLKDITIMQLKNLNNATAADISTYVKELSQYKDNISEYTDLLVSWFRDVLIFKASRDINELIFKDMVNIIDKYSMNMSYNNIEQIFINIDKVKTRLNANVNFELTMQLLLMSIRDSF